MDLVAESVLRICTRTHAGAIAHISRRSRASPANKHDACHYRCAFARAILQAAMAVSRIMNYHERIAQFTISLENKRRHSGTAPWAMGCRRALFRFVETKHIRRRCLRDGEICKKRAVFPRYLHGALSHCTFYLAVYCLGEKTHDSSRIINSVIPPIARGNNN